MVALDINRHWEVVLGLDVHDQKTRQHPGADAVFGHERLPCLAVDEAERVRVFLLLRHAAHGHKKLGVDGDVLKRLHLLSELVGLFRVRRHARGHGTAPHDRNHYGLLSRTYVAVVGVVDLRQHDTPVSVDPVCNVVDGVVDVRGKGLALVLAVHHDSPAQPLVLLEALAVLHHADVEIVARELWRNSKVGDVIVLSGRALVGCLQLRPALELDGRRVEHEGCLVLRDEVLEVLGALELGDLRPGEPPPVRGDGGSGPSSAVLAKVLAGAGQDAERGVAVDVVSVADFGVARAVNFGEVHFDVLRLHCHSCLVPLG
mmetsp:Transcript_3324/g.7833  ORF Transcript_3324/g.7833 Transcript_3324/m.7833 type:complete len:316 (-) Transcript_3324:236-1183(-)